MRHDARLNEKVSSFQHLNPSAELAFEKTLAGAMTRCHTRLLGWCIMGNHSQAFCCPPAAR